MTLPEPPHRLSDTACEGHVHRADRPGSALGDERAAVSLAPNHARLLELSAIAPKMVAARGYRTVTDVSEIRAMGFSQSCSVPGLLIPVHGVDGTIRTHQYRPDTPRLTSSGKPRKYEFPCKSRQALDVPPAVRDQIANPETPLWVTEGARKADAAVSAGLVCISISGVWNWRGTNGNGGKTALPDWDLIALNGRTVYLCFDSDVMTKPEVERALARLSAFLTFRRAVVTPVYLPADTREKAGLDDYLARHSIEELQRLIGSSGDAKPAGTSTPQKGESAKPKQGREVQFIDPEPWPDPVNGRALLDTIAATFSRYLALPAHASTALALWVLHAYSFSAWFTSPFLAITSPTKRCGKTLLLIVLGALVPRRLFASNVTSAVLFRTIEKYGPTLLVDEADTFIRDNEELRGVLNSGHTRTTAVVIRAVGDDHDPRAFSTWCPKAIALIGKLPETLGDRAIEVAMARRTVGESVQRLRQDRIEAECSNLRQQAARWATDHLHELQDADPQVPASLHDRAADCWRPLLALADLAGGDWPEKARAAATALSGATDDADQPVTVLLLADVRAVFDARGTQELSSSDLASALHALDSRPWATWGRNSQGLTTHALARLLRDFKVHPLKLRFGDQTANGYTRRSFEDAWARYPPTEMEHRNNADNDGPETPLSRVEQPTSRSGCEIAGSANSDGVCSSVPVQTGEDLRPAVDDWESLW